MVLLTAKDELLLGAGRTIAYPMADNHVLSVAEQATVQAAVDGYNAAIATIADEQGCTLVDINALLDDLSTKGYMAGGVRLGTSFITGGLFSLDGIHPTSVGYTIIANEFIRRINEDVGANSPLASIKEALGN